MKNVSLAQLAALAPFAATEDQQLSITSAALINGSGQTLKSVSGAAHGTVTLRNGKVVFHPDADFSGIATFDYTLVDSHGVATVHTATIDVAPVADAPTLSVALGNGVGAVNKVGAEFTANTTTAGGQFFSTVSTRLPPPRDMREEEGQGATTTCSSSFSRALVNPPPHL